VLGYSRQYYYKLCKQVAHDQDVEQQVLGLVQEERKLLPRIGGKKVYHLISEVMKQKEVKMGRDKLFTVMRDNGLLIAPRRRYVQTTNSRHRLKKYPNKAKEMIVQEPDQLWVSDITLIKAEDGYCYLNMVTDAYSRKIVGYAIADNMEAESMIGALRMALSQKPLSAVLMHHSDRGSQYCGELYVSLMKRNNCIISMTENSDPYENALAERMNRTIKEEFGLDGVVKSKDLVYKMVKEAIELYNYYRPHLSLKMKTPDQIHKKSRLLNAVGT
jgi:transposase InsO family protein